MVTERKPFLSEADLEYLEQVSGIGNFDKRFRPENAYFGLMLEGVATKRAAMFAFRREVASSFRYHVLKAVNTEQVTSPDQNNPSLILKGVWIPAASAIRDAQDVNRDLGYGYRLKRVVIKPNNAVTAEDLEKVGLTRTEFNKIMGRNDNLYPATIIDFKKDRFKNRT